MKRTFRSVLAAALASAMTFCAAASLPQSAYSANAIAQENNFIELIDTLPDESEYSELGLIYMDANNAPGGFELGKNGNAINGAEVFYVYMPKTEGVDTAAVSVTVRYTDPAAPEQEKALETELSGHPAFGALTAKIDMTGMHVNSIAVIGKHFAPTAEGNGASQDVYLYRAVSHLPENPIPQGDGVMSLPDQLPENGKLTQVKKFTFPIDKVQAHSIPVPLPENPSDFAGYYLYIPQQAGVGMVEMDLELQIDSNNGDYLTWIQTNLDGACIDAAPVVLKIASSQTMVRRLELTKRKAETIGTEPAKSFDVYFYIYQKEPEKPEQPVKLEAAELPQGANLISSTVRLEDAAKKTTFSLDNLTYHFLDAQFDGDFSRYPQESANAEQWAEFRAAVELGFEKEIVTQVDGAPITHTESSQLGYVLPLLNGRATELVEPGDGNDPWACTYMNACCNFEGMVYSGDSSEGEAIEMPAGIGSLNVSAADCIGNQPYQFFYLKLSHASDQADDKSDYAQLIFHVYQQNQTGKWEEFRKFEVAADMEKQSGSTAGTVVKIPNDLLKPDNGWLYIIEPKFFSCGAAGEQGEQNPVTEGTGYVSLYGANTICGDLNSDGAVNAADAVLLCKFLTAQTTLTDSQMLLADVSGDKKVNAVDLTLLKRTLLS